MKIRVVSNYWYEDWYEEKFREREGKPLSELTDEEFMEIYQRSDTVWEFDSLKEFADEFNYGGIYAPSPSHHIIHFFPNE